MSHIGDGSGGISSKAAAAASAAAADDGGLPLRVLVWNAQDWKYGALQSAASQKRGAALEGMLREHRPDLVVLLETGEAGKGNDHIARHAAAAGKVTGIAYSAPAMLSPEDTKSVHDKSAVYFFRADLPVAGVQSYPIGDEERRPMIIVYLKRPPVCLVFLHAIAERHAAARQVYDLTMSLRDRKPSLFAGDLNHEPPAPPVHAMDRPRRVQADAPQVVSTGLHTHYSSASDEYAELDWGYWVPAFSNGATWTAEGIYETKDETDQTLIVWKGAGANGASDHAAILYELTKS